MTTPTPPAFPPAGRWVEAWLSGARFAVYLAATGADRDRALVLYEWNAQLSAALLHDLAHVEVGLRNAYDVALSARWPGPPHWTLRSRHGLRSGVSDAGTAPRRREQQAPGQPAPCDRQRPRADRPARQDRRRAHVRLLALRRHVDLIRRRERTSAEGFARKQSPAPSPGVGPPSLTL